MTTPTEIRIPFPELESVPEGTKFASILFKVDRESDALPKGMHDPRVFFIEPSGREWEVFPDPMRPRCRDVEDFKVGNFLLFFDQEKSVKNQRPELSQEFLDAEFECVFLMCRKEAETTPTGFSKSTTSSLFIPNP